MSSSISDDALVRRQGLWYGLGAYSLWGLVPLYFKQLAHLQPLDVLAHRVVWSFLLLAAIVGGARRWGDALRACQSPQVMLFLTGSTTLIAINWFTYIHAVSTSQVIQASLGYFITPLANVALGVAVLGERLRRLQLVALLIAAAAVFYLTWDRGHVPWIAISLACSFSCYGLLRKTVAVDGLLGLLVETGLLFPLATGYIVYDFWNFAPGEVYNLPTLGLLALGGAVTTGPLLLFAAAARRLTMTTLGFLQYLAPSLQFLVAVLVLGEKFTQSQFISFCGIWAAVGLYTVDSLVVKRGKV